MSPSRAPDRMTANSKLPPPVQKALNGAHMRLSMLLHPVAGLAITEVKLTQKALDEVEKAMACRTVNKTIEDALNRLNGRFFNLLQEPSVPPAMRDGVKLALSDVVKALEAVSKHKNAGPRDRDDRDGALRCIRSYMESNSQMPEAVRRALVVLVPELRS